MRNPLSTNKDSTTNTQKKRSLHHAIIDKNCTMDRAIPTETFGLTQTGTDKKCSYLLII